MTIRQWTKEETDALAAALIRDEDLEELAALEGEDLTIEEMAAGAIEEIAAEARRIHGSSLRDPNSPRMRIPPGFQEAFNGL